MGERLIKESSGEIKSLWKAHKKGDKRKKKKKKEMRDEHTDREMKD